MNRDEQVLKNLDLVEGFLHDIIDAPKLLDGIPDGTTVVLVPEDDTELGDANVKAARALLHRGPTCGSQMRSAGSGSQEPSADGVYLQPVRS
jgi:hypothetical protein